MIQVSQMRHFMYQYILESKTCLPKSFIVILQYKYTMGTTRTDLYSDEQVNLAAISKVLGHPARIAILQYLQQQPSCICGDIVTEIGLAQPTISQHLRELKNIGLIKGNIDGTKICYCIDYAVLEKFQAAIHQMLEHKPTKNC